jgi:exopolysaccharide biosynthesis polyprenyl glycosylphosphotransferase
MTYVPVEELPQALDARTLEILEHRRSERIVRRRGWLVRRALLVGDVAGLSTAFVIAQSLYAARISHHGVFSRGEEAIAFAASLPLWILALKLYGLYEKDEERADHSTTDELARLFNLVTACTFVLYAVAVLTRWFDPAFGKVFLFWLFAVICTMAARALARTLCRRHISYVQNTIVVGAGDVGQMIAQKVRRHPEYGLNLVGFVDNDPLPFRPGLGDVALLGQLEELPGLVGLLDVERVIIAFTSAGDEQTLGLVATLKELDVQVDIVPRLFDSLGPTTDIHVIEGIPVVTLPRARLSSSSRLIKRATDLVLTSCVLIVAAPLMLLVAVLVKLDSPGPVIYRHERIGRGGRAFDLRKFRTMYRESCRGTDYGGEAAEQLFLELLADPARRVEFESSYKLREDPRVTRIGAFLRRTSIDELPQLLNVLAGDISLVGPRALTKDELDRYYGAASTTLLAARPGITGYWQINGRSKLEYEDRVRLDLAYIGAWTLGLDLSILLRTVKTLFSTDRAY